MSSQFCQEWGGSRWREGEDNLVTTCMVLSAWGCRSVTTSSPAVELQWLMYVETLICRYGNLVLSPTSNFLVLSGELLEHQGIIPTRYLGEGEWVTACRYLCLCTHWRGGHPECQFNLDTSYYRDGTGWDQPSPCDTLYQISQQKLWLALLISEGRRHLPKGRFLPVSVWGESVQLAWRWGLSPPKVTVSH